MNSVGEIVVYHHYVCELVSFREAYYEGKDYYELRALFAKALKFFIPVENAVPPAIRRVMSKPEALALIDSIANIETVDAESLARNATSSSLLNRNTEDEYSRRLHTYTPEQLLGVMKAAYESTAARSSRSKSATTIDKKYLQLAQDLLCDELSFSLGIDRGETPDFLERRIKLAMSKARGE